MATSPTKFVVPPEVVRKLRETVALLDDQQVQTLEDILGVELISGLVEGEPHMHRISRLALANAFINDAKPGLRLAIVVDDDVDNSEVSEVYFIDVWDQYTDDQKSYAEAMASRPVLKKLLEGTSGTS